MTNAIVVPSGDGAHAAAAREVSAVAGARSVAQVMTPQEQQALKQEIERATREATAQARQAAAAAAAAAAQRSTEQQPGVLVVPDVPSHSPMPRITVERDGKMIHIGGARAATAAGAQVPSPDMVIRPEIPAEAVVIAIAFFIMLAFIAVGLPVARAIARRMDRQGSATPAPFPSDVSDRIERIEHAVEAIAIEVERVSEGQRFTTKLLSEMRAPATLGAGAAAGQFAGEQR